MPRIFVIENNPRLRKVDIAKTSTLKIVLREEIVHRVGLGSGRVGNSHIGHRVHDRQAMSCFVIVMMKENRELNPSGFV